MVVRTVVFPIYPTEEQKEILLETLNLYSEAWKHCIDVAWCMEKLSAVELHNATYRELKESLGLKSQYLCSARNRAVENVKAMRALQKRDNKISKPVANLVPIRLDARTLSFDKPRKTASVATQQKRIKIPLIWHKQALRYRDWDCKAGEIGIDGKDRWVLRLIFEKGSVKPERTENIVGIDRGIRHAVVSSDNRFFGKPEWMEHDRKILSLRSQLQSKGTKSAKKHLKKLAGRQKRFKENCDRVVAKEFLSKLNPGDTIVFERLTNIKKRCGVKGKAHKKHRSKIGRWSFKRLEKAITYGTELSGIYVEYIEPHYTSQMCSKCNKVLKSNRKTQSLYSCSCGLNLNADLNASRNISKLWRMANGFTSGLPVNQPIVAGS